MSPSLSSCTLEGSNILHATVSDGSESVEGALDLNDFIGNVNGAFSWGGSNFSSGAQNVRLSGNGTALEADLPDSNGDLAHSVIGLNHEFTTYQGQTALKAIFEVPHSTAHALANNNAEADSSVAKDLDTIADNTTVLRVQTVQGDASTYWPGDVSNAPAPGFWGSLFHVTAHIGAKALETYNEALHKQAEHHSSGGGCTIL